MDEQVEGEPFAPWLSPSRRAALRTVPAGMMKGPRTTRFGICDANPCFVWRSRLESNQWPVPLGGDRSIPLSYGNLGGGHYTSQHCALNP